MSKFNIGWGLTNVCNMNCAFCYSKDTREKVNNAKLADWIKFIDENHQYIDSINYGTGENAIQDDFFTFIKYVRDNYPSITQSLTSNGYIYERVSKNRLFYEIYKECIDEIDISLDFRDKVKHNYFRGQDNAYDWAISALQMLKDDNKKSTIVFVGIEETMQKDNIDGLFELANKYNALLRLNIYRPVSESKEINERFKLNYNTLKEALIYIAQKYQIVSLNDILYGSLYTNEIINENTGINSIRILPDGSICPSTYLISDEFRNKYHINQSKVLENINFKAFIDAPIPIECENCEIINKCRGGVFDRRFLANGSLDKRDPYCPFENGDELPKEEFKILKKERISVHDGYLPTLFFKN